MSLKQPFIAKTNFINANLTINYQLARGLNFGTSLGYNNSQANQQFLQTIVSQDPLFDPRGSATYGNTDNKNWIIEPQLNYDANVGKGKISLLIGTSIQQTKTDGSRITGNDYTR